MNQDKVEEYVKSLEKLKSLKIFDEIPEYDWKILNIETFLFNLVNIINQVDMKKLNEDEKLVLKKLFGIFSMHINSMTQNRSFVPYKNSKSGRTTDLEDIDDEFVQALFDRAECIFSNELILARIFDFVWVRKGIEHKKIYLAGDKVFDLYMTIFENLLKSKNYYYATKILDRLNVITFSLGKKFLKKDAFINKLKMMLNENISDENVHFMYHLCLNLINIQFASNNKEYYYKIAEVIEKYLSREDILLSWHKDFTDLLEKIYSKFTDRENEQKVLKKLAERYVLMAEVAEHQFIKISYLTTAIKVYRRIYKNPFKEKISSLCCRIQELFEQQDNVYQSIPFDIDVTKDVTELLRQFENLDFQNSIFNLWGLHFRLPNEEQAKSVAQKNNFSITDFIPIMCTNHKGQIVSVEKGNFFESQNNLLYRTLFVKSQLEPVLDLLNERFFFNEYSLYELFIYNPFVPRGYERIFSRGFYYFLKKMYVEAASILVPLLENSLKYMLSDKEATITLSRVDETIQDKIDMKQLLDLIEKHKLLDNKFLYYLRELLVNPNYNIRNYVAHGLYSEKEFYGIDVILLLYIMFVLSVDNIFKPFIDGKK